MTQEVVLGFGIPVTIGSKNYVLLENRYRDWWIAIEDKIDKQNPLILVYAVIGENGELITE